MTEFDKLAKELFGEFHLSVFPAILYRKDNGRGWSLFEGDLVHGGETPDGSWIVLKVHRTISDCLRNKEPRIIMIKATEENLRTVRAIEDYANIPCCQRYGDFVRALKSTEGECAVNCDFRLRKDGKSWALELCNPQFLDEKNENDAKLMTCHNQKIIGTDGDNRFLLANGMIIWINWLCWVDALHLLKIIPIKGKIIGNHRNGRYIIPNGIEDIDVVCEEGQMGNVGNEYYATPTDFSKPRRPRFLDLEDAARVPRISCKKYEPHDMCCKAENLRGANK